MTMTDLYALLDECAAALDHSLQCLMDDRSLEHPLAMRIRAAQPQQQELPTDAELLDLFFEYSTEFGYMDVDITEDDALAVARAVLARWGRPAPPAEGEVAELASYLNQQAEGQDGCGWHHDAAILRRAADLLERGRPAPSSAAEALAARPLLEEVARLGTVIGTATVGRIIKLATSAETWLRDNPPGQPIAIEPRGCPAPGACGCVVPQPAPPAEGEVAELVAVLRSTADEDPDSARIDPQWLTRAADLLERGRPAPAPIPVAERRPGPEDCGPDERCWMLVPWYITGRYDATHWLPAHALPLPGITTITETTNDQ